MPDLERASPLPRERLLILVASCLEIPCGTDRMRGSGLSDIHTLRVTYYGNSTPRAKPGDRLPWSRLHRAVAIIEDSDKASGSRAQTKA